MNITIPDGFFPKPGVPFSTWQQRDLGIALHAIGQIKLQKFPDRYGKWSTFDGWHGHEKPSHFRIEPAEPIVVESEESWVYECGSWKDQKGDAFNSSRRIMDKTPGKLFKVHVKLTATEIVE